MSPANSFCEASWAGSGVPELARGLLIAAFERTVQRERRVAESALEVPIAIAGQVDRDAVEPRPQRRFAAEGGEAAMRPDEGVLHDLLRVTVVVQHIEDDIEDPVAVIGHDLDKGVLIAIHESVDPMQIDRTLRLAFAAGNQVGAGCGLDGSGTAGEE